MINTVTRATNFILYLFAGRVNEWCRSQCRRKLCFSPHILNCIHKHTWTPKGRRIFTRKSQWFNTFGMVITPFSIRTAIQRRFYIQTIENIGLNENKTHFFLLIWKHFRWVYGPLSSICAQSNNHWTIHILNIVSAYKYSHREMCGCCCCCFSRSFIFFSYFRVMMSIQFDALIRFKSFSLAPVVAGAVNRFWMNMCAVKRKENCSNVHHMKIILTHFRMVCRRWLVGWFA